MRYPDMRRYNDLTDLEKRIVDYIKRKMFALREDTLAEVASATGLPKKEVQEAFTTLRTEGLIYRCTGVRWYDVEVDLWPKG